MNILQKQLIEGHTQAGLKEAFDQNCPSCTHFDVVRERLVILADPRFSNDLELQAFAKAGLQQLDLARQQADCAALLASGF